MQLILQLMTDWLTGEKIVQAMIKSKNIKKCIVGTYHKEYLLTGFLQPFLHPHHLSSSC